MPAQGGQHPAYRVAQHLGISGVPEQPIGIDPFLPLLERMRSEGAVIALKLDGERSGEDNGPYTAVVTGKVLKGEFFRTDAYSLESAIEFVIVQYARKFWGFNDGM